jgi:DNA-binding MarR family transcriptional regulator
MSKLQAEIKQSKPFDSLEEELMLNLTRTAAVLGHELEQKLRPHGLSGTQYNVLRILRGAGAEGLMQCEVGARLVAQVPDVPRILTRMERAGWVQRVRGTEDRRAVHTTLTEKGLELVNGLDAVVPGGARGMFSELSREEMEQMCELLVKARSGVRDKG